MGSQKWSLLSKIVSSVVKPTLGNYACREQKKSSIKNNEEKSTSTGKKEYYWYNIVRWIFSNITRTMFQVEKIP